jgi:hypothetical protein
MYIYNGYIIFETQADAEAGLKPPGPNHDLVRMEMLMHGLCDTVEEEVS